MKIKCAIFDFDGTLFDSMFIWENAGDVYLRSLGRTPKRSIQEDVKALSLYQSACYFQKEYDLALSTDQIMAGINQTIEHFYIHDILPKPGVMNFLEQMKQANIPMCIASASDHFHIVSALERCGMSHYFDAIFTCDEVGHGKDNPAIFRRAMNYFDADYNSTLIFEDAIHAIQTAKKDGFSVISVFDKSEKQQAEIQKLSDYYIFDFRHTEGFWEFLN